MGAQDHIPFLLMLAGLAGLGTAACLDHAPTRVQAVSLVTLLAVGIAWFWLALFCLPETRDASLKASLAPFQAVLDRGRPEDRFLSVQHWNPVLMMDADPKLFMKKMCIYDPNTYMEYVRVIEEKRPRFLVGFLTMTWPPDGRPVRIELPESILRSYHPLDRTALILELSD